MSRSPIDAAFARQAVHCETLGSPFMARLCGLLAAQISTARGMVAARLRNWPGDPSHRADAVPLRLCGALHALVLDGADAGLAAVYPPHHRMHDDTALWRAVSHALHTHADRILAWLASPPQTNEVQRSAALYLGLLAVGQRTERPLVLTEIGASGGLNLNLDRYGYSFGGVPLGSSGSPVRLIPDWRGPPPPPVPVSVGARAGCDLRPLDFGQARDRLRGLAYIWADQQDRLQRTAAAMPLAAALGTRVEKQDAAAFVAQRLSAWTGESPFVLMHSIVWQYLPQATRERIEAALRQAGAAAVMDAPLAWVRMEGDGDSPGAGLRLTLWPGGEERLLARCDFHGRWIETGPESVTP